VQVAVGAHERRPVDPAGARHVGHPAAGLLDQDERRGDVPDVHPALDHRLGGAFGDERVAPEVAEAAVAPGGGDRRVEAGHEAGPDVLPPAAVNELGVLDPGYRRGSDRPAGAIAPDRPGAQAAGGMPALAQRRRAEDPDLELVIHLHREERPEERHAADVVVGPVDGVDVPADPGVAGLLAVLLAHQAVVRMRRPDARAHEPLDCLVRLRDEGAVRLRRGRDVATEPAQGDLVGGVADGKAQLQPGPQVRLRGTAAGGAPVRTEAGGWLCAVGHRSLVHSLGETVSVPACGQGVPPIATTLPGTCRHARRSRSGSETGPRPTCRASLRRSPASRSPSRPPCEARHGRTSREHTRAWSAGERRRKCLRHRPMPGGRRDETEEVGGAGHLQLVEEEGELLPLAGEDLALRR
jgi:hypothetical protein